MALHWLGSSAEIDYSHKKQSGNSGQFARVRLRFEPGPPESGFRFKSDCPSAQLDFLSGITKGLMTAKENGLLAGFPVTDVQATLIDIAYHDVDSSALTFEIAARAAFGELSEKGQPKLLEPIMKVEVMTADEFAGDIVGDISSRRGHIESTQSRGDVLAVTALAPLANLFGYAGTLKAISQGRSQFTMRYDHYAPVPLPIEPPDDLFPPAIGMRA